MADLGDTLGFSSNLYDKPVDQGGILTDATAVSLTVVKPDGTSDIEAPANPPVVTGRYTHNYATLITDPPGRYVGTWLFTLPTGATVVYVETFDLGQALVTVDEAAAHMRANFLDPDDLEQLQFLCFVATDAIERDLGIVLIKRTIIETYDGGQCHIKIEKYPIISVTTVVEDGITLTASDYVLDSPLIWRGSSTVAQTWARGRRNVAITIVAGFNNPPLIARKVALNAIQRMWQESQQAPHPMIEDLGESAITTSTGLLTPVELAAYKSLMPIVIA